VIALNKLCIILNELFVSFLIWSHLNRIVSTGVKFKVWGIKCGESEQIMSLPQIINLIFNLISFLKNREVG